MEWAKALGSHKDALHQLLGGVEAQQLLEMCTNKDNKISWEEFSGPKGTHSEVHDEL